MSFVRVIRRAQIIDGLRVLLLLRLQSSLAAFKFVFVLGMQQLSEFRTPSSLNLELWAIANLLRMGHFTLQLRCILGSLFWTAFALTRVWSSAFLDFSISGFLNFWILDSGIWRRAIFCFPTLREKFYCHFVNLKWSCRLELLFGCCSILCYRLYFNWRDVQWMNGLLCGSVSR